MSFRQGRSTGSSKIQVTYGRGIGRRPRQQSRSIQDAKKAFQVTLKKYKERVAGLDYVAREEAAKMNVDLEGWEDDPVLFPIPPGDEGVLASHAGGEAELCRQLLEDKRVRRDGRTRQDRTESRNVQWRTQLPALVDAYLMWKHNAPVDAPASSSESDGLRGHHPSSHPHDSGAPADESSPPTPGGDDSGGSTQSRDWSVLKIEFFSSSTTTCTLATPSELPNVALARGGFLGVAPVFPTAALAFDVLEAYRQMHGACLRLSIQAFCQALSALHHVPFRRVFPEQFSIAFDIYLDILHEVDTRVAVALSRNTPDWRMLNVCPPCMYSLDNEDPLDFTLLATMDGNSSLKLVDDSFRSGQAQLDTRTWRTDLFIDPSDIDQFKDEVASSQKPQVGGPDNPFRAFPSAPTTAPAAAGVAQPNPPDASMDLDADGEAEERAWVLGDKGPEPAVAAVEEPCDSKSVCAERWRNAGPEARKKMFALFQATGVFACLCRHGHVLLMCDMIRSGELMKYPLGIVKKLLDVYGPEVRIKLGYDIGCEFDKTLRSSSLAPRAAEAVTLVVPAFHGHSHNRGCQVQWHPMYMQGVGKEDFEGSERFFSFSNGLASGTRLSTAFHRHQAIEGMVGFWTQEKHASSGKFIFNNYRQALAIIEDGERALDLYSRDLKTTPADYERYLEEEREYLRNLKAEPRELTLRFEYIQALQELEQQGVRDRETISMYKKLDYLITREGYTKKQIESVTREYVNAQKRVQRAEESVKCLEDALDIDNRWLPTSPEYMEMAKELAIRKYRCSLDSLERLVVQRLFELKKLGMNGLGYKLREKIGHALKARAEAIRNALNTYNKQAAALSPPRPQLTWTDVMNMVSVGEFDLLRDAREDIRSKPWAQRANRDAMAAYFNVKRAREEIRRLNVELSRLFSFMVDEHVDYLAAIQELSTTNPALSKELAVRHRYRDAVNARVVAWLWKASRLPGFSGRLVYGHCQGREKASVGSISLPPWASRTGSEDVGDREEVDDANDVVDEPEDGAGIPGVGGAGLSVRFVGFVDGLDGEPASGILD